MLTDYDTFAHNGREFRVYMEPDDYFRVPWTEEDGHGPVSDWTTRAKRPGERVLCSDYSHKRYYDWQGAVAIAKRDGWDTEPFGQGTRGDRAARAVEADFRRLQAWCAGHWHYAVLTVELLDFDGAPTGETQSLVGVESDSSRAYLGETARELAEELCPLADAHEASGLCLFHD